MVIGLVNQAVGVTGCSVLSCSSCLCAFTPANATIGVASNTFKVTGFTASSKRLVVMLAVRNPINSNHSVTASISDKDGYTKESGSQIFPSISLAFLSSSILTFSSSSNVVYASANYTLRLDFSSQTLLDGFMIILFDSSVVQLDSSASNCIVNSNGGSCTTSTINGTLQANITIVRTILIYSVVISALRNPPSTRPYNLKISLTDSAGLPYYQLTSPNYQASQPAVIQPTASLSACTNSMATTLQISFSYLPFLPAGAFLVNDASAANVQGERVLRKLSQPVSFAANMTLGVTNWFSFQPNYYQLLVVSSDQVYNIFSLTFPITNCLPSILTLTSYRFSGLPEDAGTLDLVLPNPLT